mmetsp:Transcript_18423/g.20987  ORF Transcript_18423/g.20987 Transcript_18423/m.20987 type:complete len:566 (-) Transcript_18423:886-2583(-)
MMRSRVLSPNIILKQFTRPSRHYLKNEENLDPKYISLFSVLVPAQAPAHLKYLHNGRRIQPFFSCTAIYDIKSSVSKGGHNNVDKISNGQGIKVWEIPMGGDDISSNSRDNTNTTNHKLNKDSTLYTGLISSDYVDKKPNENQNNIIKGKWVVLSEPTKDNVDEYSIQGIEIYSKKLLKHFFPADYPKSVDPGYKGFISYCFVASTCGSAAMVLSTQSLLLAVGVGSATAAPMAGALNWVMKDLIGQLGGILFASRITSNVNNIDTDPKRWRMASAISMDAATLLEIISPMFPGQFLFIASVANVGKNIGFLTASASRAALHQSVALKNNLGDVTAKAGSQSIASSLVGTGVGISLSPFIGDNYSILISSFVCLSMIHQYCTYKSLQSVSLRKFNRHRLNIALGLFFHSNDGALTRTRTSTNDTSDRECHPLLDPTTVSKLESFIPFINPDDSHTWLKIGCPLLEITPRGPDQFHRLQSECLAKEKYILNCEVVDKTSTDNDNDGNVIEIQQVMLCFHSDATDIDILRGMFHAYTIRHDVVGFNASNSIKLHNNNDDDDVDDVDT